MKICVLVVPYDSGRYRERMGCGPHYLLENAIHPLAARSGWEIRVEEVRVPDTFTAEINTAFTLCRLVSGRVRECIAEGWFPVVLSGNCITAVGTICGCGCDRVVWFDAHGEATTPDTTTSGFLDGMGISVLTGACWKNLAESIPGFQVIPGDRILLVGARDLEDSERDVLCSAGVRQLGRGDNVKSVIPADDGLYVHFDLDVLDPSEVVWNQWAPPQGLSVKDIQNAMRNIALRAKIKTIGFASCDPAMDPDGRAVQAVRSILESVLE
jgi:arginase